MGNFGVPVKQAIKRLYALLLLTLGKVGILEQGYVDASLTRKASYLRHNCTKQSEKAEREAKWKNRRAEGFNARRAQELRDAGYIAMEPSPPMDTDVRVGF